MTHTLIGQTLDNFQITTLLGEGAMGTVYKGVDINLRRDVAIKVMLPHFANCNKLRQRFLVEARATAKLNHPGIVRVHYFGEAGQWLYIATKFIAGGNLADLFANLRLK